MGREPDRGASCDKSEGSPEGVCEEEGFAQRSWRGGPGRVAAGGWGQRCAGRAGCAGVRGFFIAGRFAYGRRCLFSFSFFLAPRRPGWDTSSPGREGRAQVLPPSLSLTPLRAAGESRSPARHRRDGFKREQISPCSAPFVQDGRIKSPCNSRN